jgi:hypothetical protein
MKGLVSSTRAFSRWSNLDRASGQSQSDRPNAFQLLGAGDIRRAKLTATGEACVNLVVAALIRLRLQVEGFNKWIDGVLRCRD